MSEQITPDWLEISQSDSILSTPVFENALVVAPQISQPKKRTRYKTKRSKVKTTSQNQIIIAAQNLLRLLQSTQHEDQICDELTLHTEIDSLLKKMKRMGCSKDEMLTIQYFLLRCVKNNLPWILAAENKLLQLPPIHIILPSINVLLEDPEQHLTALEFIFLCLKLSPNNKQHIEEDLPIEFDQHLFQILNEHRAELERKLSKTILTQTTLSKTKLHFSLKLALLFSSLIITFFIGFYCLQSYTDQALLNVLAHH